jgi:hypothetical protein
MVVRELAQAARQKTPIIPFCIDTSAPTDDLSFYMAVVHNISSSVPPTQNELANLADQVRRRLADEQGEAETQFRQYLWDKLAHGIQLGQDREILDTAQQLGLSVEAAQRIYEEVRQERR